MLPAAEINTAHSGYIDIWLQAGAVGLGLVLIMIVRFFRVAVPLCRRRQLGAENQRLIATMIAVVFTLVLYNFVESILFRPSDTLSSLVVLVVLATEHWSRLTRRVGPRVPFLAQGAMRAAAPVPPAGPRGATAAEGGSRAGVGGEPSTALFTSRTALR